MILRNIAHFFPAKFSFAMIDRLSGIAPADRSRDDLINPAVFGALSQGLNDPNSTGLLTLRHKVVAHAADADNRPRRVS
jgi:hypothetical protein